jgi:nucleotide-binding universal stress UspA family protein
MAWHPPAGLNDFGTTAVIADEDWEADARALLEQVLSSAGGRLATPRLARGPAAEALLDASRAAAMVIVGSRGLGGLGAVLLGSVSRRLVHEAEVPVMVVPDDVTC